MLRTAFLLLATLAIAIGGGAGSVWYLLEASEGIGVVHLGTWTAYPDLGSPDADPYSKARAARKGLLPIGRAEGITFLASRDTAEALLSRGCTYRIEGAMPPARFWTLHAADRALRPLLPGEHGLSPALQSASMLRRADNSFSIDIGPRAAPGNWLRVSGKGDLVLVLTLYDSPVVGTIGVEDVQLPQVKRVGCDG